MSDIDNEGKDPQFNARRHPQGLGIALATAAPTPPHHSSGREAQCVVAGGAEEAMIIG
jgi:hypothetical protein